MSGKLFLQDRPAETYGETDWFLRALVKAVNDRRTLPDQRLRLTLLLDGFLVTGEPIAAHDYIDYIKDAAGLPEVIGRIDDEDERWENETASEKHVGYIHLKNACVVNPAGQSVPKSIPDRWRIKLSAVSGFAIGNLASPGSGLGGGSS